MTDPVRQLTSFLDRNIGRCPRCMKVAFLSAVASWPLYGTLLALRPNALIADAAIVVPLALSLLWVAHAGTYGTRLLRRLRAEYGGASPQAGDRPPGGVGRRSFLWILQSTAILTATASVWLPSLAFARAGDRPLQMAQGGCPQGYPIDCGTGSCCPQNSSCCRSGCCPSGYPHKCGGRCFQTLQGALDNGCSMGQIDVCGVPR